MAAYQGRSARLVAGTAVRLLGDDDVYQQIAQAVNPTGTVTRRSGLWGRCKLKVIGWQIRVQD